MRSCLVRAILVRWSRIHAIRLLLAVLSLAAVVDVLPVLTVPRAGNPVRSDERALRRIWLRW